MGSPNFRAAIAMRKERRTLACGQTPMIAFSVHYPLVTLRRNPFAQTSIRGRIEAQVLEFKRRASDDLYRQAIATQRQAEESGFPFHPYEAVLGYAITYNQHCHLSLYRDRYEFTGGAHGNTMRMSDTWSLASGERLSLSAFFPAGREVRAHLIEEITKQADARMEQNPGIFFDDYQALILKHFCAEHFYLTPSGLAFYFQQYEIAPYVAGIVVFVVPYEAVGWRPSCFGQSKAPAFYETEQRIF